jgi:hypothetical protein
MRRSYPGANHVGVIEAAGKDVLAWITERLKRRAAQSICH